MTSSDALSPVRLRRALDAVPAYRPGKAPTVLEGVDAYKMSSNENPYPPLPSVIDVVRDAVTGMNRYPDAGMVPLRERIADACGVTADEVVTGAGSSGVLGQIMGAVVEEGDEVVYAWRSFELYPILVSLAGARSVQVPLTADARHDLSRMADAVTASTSLVIVCSPNNPTGPAVRAAELEEFLARVPSDVMVVLDEAYLEFVVAGDAPDAMALYRSHENLVVLRTFSKAYGLAGLRIGYAIARPAIADALRKAGLPFAVTTAGQEAAKASLDARDELGVRVKEIVGERGRLVDGLREQGWDVPDTEANFVWLPLGADALAFVEAADAAGLSVRGFPREGVRVSVDVPEANSRLLQVAAAFRAERADGPTVG